MKIAEGLLLRKQLEQKVRQLEPLKLQGDKGLFEVKTMRKSVNENVDELSIQAPKITLAEITKEFDLYASELRKIDTAIQMANWACDLEYKQPAEIK